MNDLIYLFYEIQSIIERHELIKKTKGENYNLFEIINLTTDETRLHSAIIADLLNPYGKHQMKDVFLKLFIDMFSKVAPENPICLNPEEGYIECEKYIGTKEDTSGGRLDIYITDGKNHIVIENKIYASDQKNQLLRYYNFLKNKSGHKILIYLSLFGEVHDIQKTTRGGEIEERKDFYTISYSEFIYDWLKACREKVCTKALIREGITHYINLIKKLTNKIDENMIKQLQQIIENNPEYIRLIPEYKLAMQEVEINLQRIFWENLENNIKEEFNICRKSAFDYKYALDKEQDYIREYYQNKNNNRFQSIEFEIPQRELSGLELRLIYGVRVEWKTYGGCLLRDKNGENVTKRIKEDSQQQSEYIRTLLKQIDAIGKDCPDIYHQNDNWLFWRYTDPVLNFRDINCDNTATSLSDIKTIVNKMMDHIKEDIKLFFEGKG